MNLNVDHQEIHKFDALASRWWDPDGELKALHDINPLRLEYINRLAPLSAKTALDIGCGGGILSEAMCRAGARVTAIDAAADPLAVAKLHQAVSGTEVTYLHTTPDEFAAQNDTRFDIVTCMELLEHVPDPKRLLAVCADRVKPNGHLFVSTINRNLKAFLFAIVGAEHLLRLLPAGTHKYSKFLKPSELAAWGRADGLQLSTMSGLSYNPLTRVYALSEDVDVNFILHFTKPS